MKNLFEAATVDEVQRRLGLLEANSARQWGTMTPAQMAAHCSAFFEMALDEARPPRMFIGRLIGPIVKRWVLPAEKRSPHNAPTVPGYAVRDDRDLQQERERLRVLIDRFAAGGPAGVTTHPHSFFGRMTPAEWARLMYLHLDHHLRQFGK